MTTPIPLNANPYNNLIVSPRRVSHTSSIKMEHNWVTDDDDQMVTDDGENLVFNATAYPLRANVPYSNVIVAPEKPS